MKNKFTHNLSDLNFKLEKFFNYFGILLLESKNHDEKTKTLLLLLYICSDLLDLFIVHDSFNLSLEFNHQQIYVIHDKYTRITQFIKS